MAIFWLWAAVALVAYTYGGYPILLWLAAKIRRLPAPLPLTDAQLPSVSVLIAAHNEERHIAAKLANCAALNYPADRIEFLIGSDGSRDGTNALVRANAAPNVRLLEFAQRRGKPATLNDLLAEARGDILVFTDANTLIEPPAIRRLVAHFANPQVGAVAGRLILRRAGPAANRPTADESLYWRYESWIKKHEGQLGLLAAAPGALQAARRRLVQPWPTGRLLSDDLLTPCRVLLQGYAVTSEHTAIGREETAPETRAELRRRIRVGEAGYNTLLYIWPLLLPWRGGVAWSFWSHKILRWLVPFLLLVIFSANLFLLSQPLYLLLLTAQLAFYAAAGLGFWLEGRRALPWWLSFPYYFAGANLALLVGCLHSFTRAGSAAWSRPAR